MTEKTKVEYRVVHVNDTQVATDATVDGELQKVVTSGVEVELVPVNSRHSAVTLRFIGKDVSAAKEKFKTGETVTSEW